jgi:uncharacterized protein (DUF488 family)
MQNDCVLYTIGYEGRDIEEFVGRLKEFGVTRLIDVREIPLSRKKGFSKSALKQRLEEENIEYAHYKALGSPTKMRHKLRADWDYDHFFEAFSAYLAGKMDVIEEVHEYLSDGINCLMCFERKPQQCHRSCVADKIKERDGNGLLIQHI